MRIRSLTAQKKSSNKTCATGILGGSFDPVHIGHCEIANAAIKHFKLKEIFFIPAGTLPHKNKTALVSSTHRMAMLKLAIENHKAFKAVDIEIKRCGKSYTYDTISSLRRKYPKTDFYFIIGSDNLLEIPSWYRYRSVLRMITLCITKRPGYRISMPQELKGAKCKTFPGPNLKNSSSEIRRRLAKNLSCRGLVDPAVLEYIKKHKLYERQGLGLKKSAAS